MTAPSPYTDDQLDIGIRRALQANDLDAAVAMLHVLAVQAPARAQKWLDAVELASSPTPEKETHHG